MTKKSELDAALDEIQKCGETLIKIVESLREPVKEELKKQPISFEELRGKMAGKARVSKANTDAIRALLAKFGVHKLSELKPEQYDAFLKEAEVIPDA